MGSKGYLIAHSTRAWISAIRLANSGFPDATAALPSKTDVTGRPDDRQELTLTRHLPCR